MPLYRLSPQSSPVSQLWSVPRPPLGELWVEARDETALSLLNRLPDDGLAIVGTRYPREGSESFTEQVIEGLQKSSLVILSGLARGIDRVAHEAALNFEIRTIGVLGCGHQHVYPPESESLRKSIIKAGGLIVSEFSPETPPAKQNFVRRNRCLAAWSRATCVIEAPAKSGALITADYAMERHATVFSMPSFPGDPHFAGNQRLIDEYAAIPLWGTHSLGAVWLDLATRKAPFELSLFRQKN